MAGEVVVEWIVGVVTVSAVPIAGIIPMTIKSITSGVIRIIPLPIIHPISIPITGNTNPSATEIPTTTVLKSQTVFAGAEEIPGSHVTIRTL